MINEITSTKAFGTMVHTELRTNSIHFNTIMKWLVIWRKGKQSGTARTLVVVQWPVNRVMKEGPAIHLERQQGFGFWKGWRTGRLRGNEWVQEREWAWLMKSRSAWRKASRRRYCVPNARVHRGKFFPSIILFSNGQERIMTIWKLRKWRFGGQQLVGHKYRCRGCCWGSRVLWHTLGGKCIRQPFGEHFGRDCSNCEFPSRYWFWRNTCVCILRGRKRDVHWTVQKLGYKSHVY